MEQLTITHGGETQGSGLETLTQLQSLTIYVGYGYTADSVLQRVPSLTALTALQVNDVRRLPTVSKFDLSKLAALACLKIHGCGSITAAALRRLTRLAALQVGHGPLLQGSVVVLTGRIAGIVYLNAMPQFQCAPVPLGLLVSGMLECP